VTDEETRAAAYQDLQIRLHNLYVGRAARLSGSKAAYDDLYDRWQPLRRT
jgi:hypothetical protein